MSPRGSLASFDSSTKLRIRTKYTDRCAICLARLIINTKGTQFAPLFDSSSAGLGQVLRGIELGTIPNDYQRSSVENGMAQCASCYIGLYAPGHIALSLPLPLLRYILNYLRTRSATDRRPLHVVFTLLVRGIEGLQLDLPDFTSIIPYIGLYSLVPLHPEALHHIAILTPHFPSLSVIQETRFAPAPAGTSPLAPNAARIFDVLSLTDDVSFSPGPIPLSPSMPGFNENRYWRLPVQPGVILDLIMQRATSLPASLCEEIRLSQTIHGYLAIQCMDVGLGEPGPGNSGGTGGNAQGGPLGPEKSGGTGSGGGPGKKRKGYKKDEGPPAKSTRRSSDNKACRR